MARHRTYGVDLAYSEWHRRFLSEFYKRDGHRLDLADRDWTEFCHFCKQPVAIMEEVIDIGQNLDEKSTTVTRNLAHRAGIDAYLIAPRIDRPSDMQDEINRLQNVIIELQTLYPIPYFTIRQLYPEKTALLRFLPEGVSEFIRVLHRSHHVRCDKAQKHPDYIPVKIPELRAARRRIGLFNGSGFLGFDKGY